MSPPQRTLVLLRHAKSDWDGEDPDQLRPLAERGRRDAPAIGRWLREHAGVIDLALCSPATRARQTWQLATAELDPAPLTREDDRIYAATAQRLLAVVRSLPDAAATVALVGHNPGMSDLAALLTGQSWPMRTAAVALLTWSGPWSAAAPVTAAALARAVPRG